jgi:hypothetical protein
VLHRNNPHSNHSKRNKYPNLLALLKLQCLNRVNLRQRPVWLVEGLRQSL